VRKGVEAALEAGEPDPVGAQLAHPDRTGRRSLRYVSVDEHQGEGINARAADQARRDRD
jgi:hypothetical protein